MPEHLLPVRRLASGHGSTGDDVEHSHLGARDNLLDVCSSGSGSRHHERAPAPHHEVYSDEDIGLVHEIVNAAQSLLPSLPERDQLPTTALFLAADDVYRQHGMDPEHVPLHIASLIFKIGGERRHHSLVDKFRAVLDRLGIELQFTDSGELADPTGHTNSAVVTDLGHVADTANLANLGSYAQPAPLANPGPLARRASFANPSSGFADLDDDSLTGSLSSSYRGKLSPPRSPQAAICTADRQRDGRPFAALSGGEGSSSRHERPINQPVHRSGGEGCPAEDRGMGGNRRQQLSGYAGFRGSQGSLGRGWALGAHDSPGRGLGTSPPNQLPRELPGLSGDTGRHQSSSLSPGGDHSRQEASLDDLEARLRSVQEKQYNILLTNSFTTWHAKAKQCQQDHDALGLVAGRTDARTLLTEVLDIWREEAQDAQERRAEAEAAIEHSRWVGKMEKRATRVYEIYTARTTLEAWRDLALEERSRTAVARRHLVRKRAFDGWHAHHVKEELKVENFILGHFLKKWTDAALHQEVRSEVASQWYDQQLLKDSVDTMWEEYNNRIADEVYATELVNDCLRHWSTKARELREEYQIASTLDERLVRDEIIKDWLDALDTQRFDAHERTRQWLILGCRRDLDYWQEQARLSALLRQYNTKRDQKVICDALDVWQRALAHAQDEAAVADAFMVMEPIEHWEREMKLKLWVEREEHETKAAVLEHWALEEKLAWYRRYDDTNLKRQTLDTLFAAAQQARRERESLERDAAEADAYYLAGDTVDAWLGAVDKMRIHHHNANLVNLYRTTRPCIDHWREQQQLSQARTAYFRRQADKHRARALVNDVLDRWPGIAEAARRERMMTKLRQFRRKYKVELAQECLDQWLEATADALDRKDDADQVHLEYKREDLKDCLDLWNRAAKQAQVVHQIAADAELEVYLNKWQEQFEEAKENLQDAIDFDADNTRRRCWEKWEFETLQAGGKRHLATTLLEKNERRVRRRILNEWHQKAVPGAADLLNPRLSTLSARRSVRQQLSRSTTAASGFYTASQLAILRPPPDPGSSTPQVGLGPMSEFDEEPLVPDPDDPGFMSTPTRLRSSTRTPARRLTSTPSAILPSPYERELRRQYGGVGLMRQRGVGFSDINEESGEDLEH